MLPHVPKHISQLSSQFSGRKSAPRLTPEERTAMIKERYGLSHGKGKRKRGTKRKGK